MVQDWAQSAQFIKFLRSARRHIIELELHRGYHALYDMGV